MKKLFLGSLIALGLPLQAQTISNASFLKAKPLPDVLVPFRYTDPGEERKIEWGLDLAWLSEGNVRTGVQYAGKEIIDIIRLSFRPTGSVEDGKLTSDMTNNLNKRARIVKNWCKSDVAFNINCDHPSVDDWYKEGGNNQTASLERARRWAKCIDLHIDAFKAQGLTNWVSISPLNEPDLLSNQQMYSGSEAGRMLDFLNVNKVMQTEYDGKYDGIRFSGGNTLNDDRAYDWWNYMKTTVQEGNTHQLAGSFDNYANFFQKVKAYGHQAANDELHNVMEAMVGVEYGMQRGIWWGTAEYARSQFMKATYQGNPGRRLAYGEHRNNWTAASVYRLPDGRVQAFGGMSERQSYTTIYNFLALDRPVWYNGERGRDFMMLLPGGTGYQTGQTGAEFCIDVQGGDDVMPYINGTYKIVNVNSGFAMGFASSPTSGWVSATQQKITASTATRNYNQWTVVPHHDLGDYNYVYFKLNNNSNMYLDLYNGNYNSGANIGAYPGPNGAVQQFYLQYAGDGAFFIRARIGNNCLEVAGSSLSTGANIQMGAFTGKDNQKWRFIAADAVPDKVAPAVPADLQAEAQPSSVKLQWTASEDKDFKSYTILRSEDGADWYTLCNELTGNVFVDNEAVEGHTYYYKVYTEDISLNLSEASTVVTATPSGEPSMTMHLTFNDTLTDATINANHAAFYGTPDYVDGALTAEDPADKALSFDGRSSFVQLPYTVGQHDAMTIAFRLYYLGGNTGQHVFDFGNDPEHYMYFTPNSGSGMSFVIRNGSTTKKISSTAVGIKKWYNIAITISEEGTAIYKDGKKLISLATVNIKPSDVAAHFNYIGRGQTSVNPLFKGSIDDFCIYNYAMTEDEIMGLLDGVETPSVDETSDATQPAVYDLTGRKATRATRGVTISGGKKAVRR